MRVCVSNPDTVAKHSQRSDPCNWRYRKTLRESGCMDEGMWAHTYVVICDVSYVGMLACIHVKMPRSV